MFNEKGITLVEIIVVVFIISIFSVILISDFPKIQGQFALSRDAAKLAQDLRKAQDLALSGVPVLSPVPGASPTPIPVAGYGVYVDASKPKEYKIYADSCQPFNHQYNSCDNTVERIDTNSIGSGGMPVSVKIRVHTNVGINTNPGDISINFTPPNPKVDILNSTVCLADYGGCSSADIILSLDSDPTQTRTVTVNSVGLIETK